ncbi:MAG: tRNA (adenosine(37)-N6)-threonylcarbamoyltransferase complex dimerization subunit type 1 TsaB [Thermoguttaceae bacterium]
MTKLLAIETTELRGSVAVAEGGILLVERPLAENQRSAQSLVPAIESILESQGWTPPELDAIAVAVGPGSFTGLRVGVTTAKVLAWACRAELFGVDTLEAAAWQVAASLANILGEDNSNPVFEQVLARGGATITIGINAQRGDVTSRDFLVRLGSPVPIPLGKKFRLEPLVDWLAPERKGVTLSEVHLASVVSDKNAAGGLSPAPDKPFPLLYAGPALNSRRIATSAEQRLAFLPLPHGVPSAAGVALAAAASPKTDPFTLLPVYSRESAAEEKRKQRQ